MNAPYSGDVSDFYFVSVKTKNSEASITSTLVCHCCRIDCYFYPFSSRMIQCICSFCHWIKARINISECSPEAVRIISLTSPFVNWQEAGAGQNALNQQSRTFTPLASARAFTSFPAITIVSLFARAISTPFVIVATEGRRPAAPAIPLSTISASVSSII